MAKPEVFLLDKQKQLDRFSFWDNQDWDWYKQNIPFWESPDNEIDKTYYYRWELTTKHRVYGSPESGYNYTEFINRPPWSGRYGSISCPLGLQIYEMRWLKDERPLRDYARYWYTTPGAQPRSYSNWFCDALWNAYAVNGDQTWITSLLPSMEQHYKGWVDEHWVADQGMFLWSGMRDGMESNIASRQTADGFAGADSYRPTLNAYIYGDLVAMANTADLRGEKTKAQAYREAANKLKKQVQAQLWDSKRQFFSCRFGRDEEAGGYKIRANTLLYEDGKYKGSPYGRQLIGYVPWMFNLPDKNKGYEVAWKGVTDPEVFFAKYGLYTVEKHDPLFLIVPTSCVWSGNNWPYAQAQTLQAMANVLNDYPQNTISKNDYFKVFSNYTVTQRKDGLPYLAETSDPNTGVWTFDELNKSEHYFHSSYNDLLITGLAGLRPRADNTVEVNPLAPDTWAYFALDDVAYHGHRLSVTWDKTGQRYRRGKGLTVWIDGKVAATRPTLGRLTAKLPTTPPITRTMADPTFVNVAVNNDSTYYPKLRASSIGQGSALGDLYDGVSYYHAGRPVNRWVSDASGPSQWVELDFGTPRTIEVAKLFLLDDGASSTVRAPQAIRLEIWNGERWTPVTTTGLAPVSPAGHRPNTLRFAPLTTSRIRAVLDPQSGASVGMTEFEVWGHNTVPLTAAPIPNNLAIGATPSASYTSPYDRIEEINDGVIVMDGGRNRWTAYESKNPTDWVQLDFPNPVTIGRVGLCLFGDTGGVRLPKSFSIETWDGSAWQPVRELGREPVGITPKVPNEITIQPVNTTRLRVTFVHDGNGRSGLSELLVFPPQP